jgi:hypothetical protein
MRTGRVAPRILNHGARYKRVDTLKSSRPECYAKLKSRIPDVNRTPTSQLSSLVTISTILVSVTAKLDKKAQTSVPLAGFEPTIQLCRWPNTRE